MRNTRKASPMFANLVNDDIYGQFVSLVTDASVQTPPCSSDPELWWSHDALEVQAAKDACRTCPLLSPCLRYAVEGGEMEGVWGATDRDERQRIFNRLRSQQRAAGVPPLDRKAINLSRGRNHREALK